MLEDTLRCMVSNSGDNWVKLLATVEYAHATSVNASTKLTPFEANTGRKVSNMVAQTRQAGAGGQPLSKFAADFAKDRRELVLKARDNLQQANFDRKNITTKRDRPYHSKPVTWFC